MEQSFEIKFKEVFARQSFGNFAPRNASRNAYGNDVSHCLRVADDDRIVFVFARENLDRAIRLNRFLFD